MKSIKRYYPLIICLPLIALVVSCWLLVGAQTKNFVTVDVHKIQGQFIRQVATRKLDDKSIKKLSQQFNQSLKSAIQEYGITHHVTLIKKDALLTRDVTCLDITKEVMEIISKKMRAQHHV